ncbi:MAG: retroviral-like aspartic protease family protein [Myxococcota bacterium]
MGYTYVTAEIANPADMGRWRSLSFLVDTGALLCLVPRPVLESLGIAPQARRGFKLADGSRIERAVGIAAVRVAGQVTGTDVIFGEPDDKPLLGVTALEQIGLAPDPATGELKPLEMLLVGLRGPL